jgi:hypothetical protein
MFIKLEFPTTCDEVIGFLVPGTSTSRWVIVLVQNKQNAEKLLGTTIFLRR